jgi:hypothetical protein
MRIRFERTGGFMGTRMTVNVDTATLPPDKSEDLVRLVEISGFFDLPEKIVTPTPSPDRFSYTLTIEDEARRHTLETSDEVAPETLRPLLRRLTAMARSTSVSGSR